MKVANKPEKKIVEINSSNIMMFNWRENTDVLSCSEELLSRLSLNVDKVTFSINDKSYSGDYSRLKRVVAENTESDLDFFDFKVTSKEISKDSFYPHQAFCAYVKKLKCKRFLFSFYEESLEINKETVIDIYKQNLEKFGLFYGALFSFPTSYGPDYYFSSINTMPSGVSFADNREYRKRLDNWRENFQSRNINPTHGFFRDLYEYNFITMNHLDKKINGKLIHEIALENGELIELDAVNQQYLWVLHGESLDKMRQLFEPSGFILSSNYPVKV